MTSARARIGLARYAVRIDASGHAITADEPAEHGGGNAGPNPYDLLLSALAACTAITLRMYAERKGWDVPAIGVELHFTREGKEERIARKISLDGDLTEEQRARMADIAERTPVTLTLKRGVPISTELSPAGEPIAAHLDERLDEALDETFPASDSPAVTP